VNERPRLTSRARLRYDHARDRWLLLSPERGLVLNGSAAAIVRKLQEGVTLNQLAAAFASVDVIAFLERLAERGLVE
jgi:pyrroloquinoline quinone biosynthesis protein D